MERHTELILLVPPETIMAIRGAPTHSEPPEVLTAALTEPTPLALLATTEVILGVLTLLAQRGARMELHAVQTHLVQRGASSNA